MADKIYVDDVGVTLRVYTGVDLTTATVTELHVQKPGATTEWVWTGSLDPANSYQIQYTTIAGDFDTVGEYTFQAYVEFTPASIHHGDVFSLYVNDIFT
jgi:hypothetical protein